MLRLGLGLRFAAKAVVTIVASVGGYLLGESGDFLTTEGGDRLTLE